LVTAGRKTTGLEFLNPGSGVAEGKIMQTYNSKIDLDDIEQGNIPNPDIKPKMSKESDAPRPIVLCASILVLTYYLMTGVI
jgi:hypothetical protein